MWRIIWKTLFCRYLFNTNSTFTTITYHNMQHLSVTTERNVPILKWLCHSLRVSSVYIVDFSILQYWAEDYVNICGLHSMFRTVLYANTTAQQFPPHFRAFPQLSSRKIPPLAVARLSSVLCLWLHQDIVIQLYLAQWYSPDNAYIILHRWFPCLFFFLTEFLWVTYCSSFAPLKLLDRRHDVVVAAVNSHRVIIRK